MEDILRTLLFILILMGGPLAATFGCLGSLQLLTRTGWFFTDESNTIEIFSIEFENPVFKSKWHSIVYYALTLFGMFFVFILYVKTMDVIFFGGS